LMDEDERNMYKLLEQNPWGLPMAKQHGLQAGYRFYSQPVTSLGALLSKSGVLSSASTGEGGIADKVGYSATTSCASMEIEVSPTPTPTPTLPPTKLRMVMVPWGGHGPITEASVETGTGTCIFGGTTVGTALTTPFGEARVGPWADPDSLVPSPTSGFSGFSNIQNKNQGLGVDRKRGLFAPAGQPCFPHPHRHITTMKGTTSKGRKSGKATRPRRSTERVEIVSVKGLSNPRSPGKGKGKGKGAKEREKGKGKGKDMLSAYTTTTTTTAPTPTPTPSPSSPSRMIKRLSLHSPLHASPVSVAVFPFNQNLDQGQDHSLYQYQDITQDQDHGRPVSFPLLSAGASTSDLNSQCQCTQMGSSGIFLEPSALSIAPVSINSLEMGSLITSTVVSVPPSPLSSNGNGNSNATDVLWCMEPKGHFADPLLQHRSSGSLSTMADLNENIFDDHHGYDDYDKEEFGWYDADLNMDQWMDYGSVYGE
jgi:hypothetical protein